MKELIEAVNRLPLKYTLKNAICTGWIKYKKENNHKMIELRNYFLNTPELYDFKLKEDSFNFIVKLDNCINYDS